MKSKLLIHCESILKFLTEGLTKILNKNDYQKEILVRNVLLLICVFVIILQIVL